MRNRKVIVSFALVFAAVFALFYYVLFQLLSAKGGTEARTLYLNQVGIFAEKENADKICEKLEKKKMNKRLFILFVFLFWSDLSICHGLAICQTNPLKTGVFRCKVQVGRKFSSFEGVKRRFL